MYIGLYMIFDIICLYNVCNQSSVSTYFRAYITLVGGALALRPPHMTLVNGFSNTFWGWGGEDDDMYNRYGAPNSQTAMFVYI